MRGKSLPIPAEYLQRDEELGVTGNAHAFAPTRNCLYDTAGVRHGWHEDLMS